MKSRPGQGLTVISKKIRLKQNDHASRRTQRSPHTRRAQHPLSRRPYPDLPPRYPGPVSANGKLWCFQTLPRVQVKMVLINRRCNHDALPQTAHQATRQNRRMRRRVHVINGKHPLSPVAIGKMKNRYLTTINQRAYAGVRHNIAKLAHRSPRLDSTKIHDDFPKYQPLSNVASQTVSTTTGICFNCRSANVAGRICPRSSINVTFASPASLLTKCRKRLRVSGSVTAFFHSHSYVSTTRCISTSSSAAIPSLSRTTTSTRYSSPSSRLSRHTLVRCNRSAVRT